LGTIVNKGNYKYFQNYDFFENYLTDMIDVLLFFRYVVAQR